jgi:hypothetical protein
MRAPVKLSFLLIVALFSSCGLILQKTASKNFKDSVVHTDYYKSLNKRQQDFFYLKTICEKYIPNKDFYFSKTERELLESKVLNRLSAKNITETEFKLLLQSYLSRFQNQHTWLSLQGIPTNSIYPFIAFNQDSSWYLLNALNNTDRTLLGKKITKFNNVPINQYEQKLFTLTSAENITAKRKAILNKWYRPISHEFLSGHKIDSVKLTFEDGGALSIPKVTTGKLNWHQSERDFKHHPITKYRDRIYDYQFIDSIGLTYFQFHECYDKIELKEGIRSYVKPWIRPIANLYVNIQTSKKRPSKRLKKYFDSERPVFSDYVSKMVKESNDKGIRKLIIDLRGNNGGSELLCLQLLYHLTEKEDLKDFERYIQNGAFYKHYFKNEYNEAVNSFFKKHGQFPKNDTLFFAGYNNSIEKLFDKITDPKSPYYVPKERPLFKGKIVVIADYSTHSAGALFAALLQDNNIAKVVGTEVSNNPTGPTTFTPLKLPNSKIDASISSQYLVRPDKTKTEKFVPDVYSEKSYQDIVNGHDPLFDKAMELLNRD